MKPRGRGIAISFRSPAAFRDACARLPELGFTRWETYSPHAVEGMESGAARRIEIPALMLGAGGLGAAGGFLLQVYAAQDFPINAGGRPLFSWPSFVPIAFELGVLTAVLTGIIVFLWRAGLPNYHHPGFVQPVLNRAVTDRYVICVYGDDPELRTALGRDRLARLGGDELEEVEL